ncbi:uroporphyrinogen-III C-methyltransferase [Oceanospirillum sanctuarii]|uniref:uroporphyrinogen-III C-methyltransferase n=1 Tax=Oceanospirillum sanctuarii TaxID=1434821 RepID=UPI000A3B41DC|nr:uroporphyrinogen-III C-methyltransferase [Oceanospirillum sanctuarii]
MSDKENKTTDTTSKDQPANDTPEQKTTQGTGFVMVGETEPAADKKSDSKEPQPEVESQPEAEPQPETKSQPDITPSKQASSDKTLSEDKPKADSVDKSKATDTEADKKAAVKKPLADKKPAAAEKPSAEKSQAEKTTAEKTSGKKGSVIALSALVIALGAAAASGYTFWQQQEKTAQALTQLSERNNQLEAQLQRQAQALNSLQTLPAATNKLNQQSQALQQQQTQQRQNLQDLATAFASTQGPKPSDWLQAEAEYLLRLANHRLQLEGDLTGAKTLLTSADERLTKADNPALFVVRQAIANEVAELNSIDTLDQSGIYFKLSALEGQIDQLPLPMEPENRSAFRQTQLEDNQEQSVWQTLWNEAKTLVVVRHRDEKITPLLPPEESLYLRHNLRLTLQQAQIALLKEEQTLFRTLLQQASSWVETHFDQSAARTQNVVSTLKALAEQNIRQQRPDISGSLNLLRDLQKQRFSSSVPAETPENSEPSSTDNTTEAPAS